MKKWDFSVLKKRVLTGTIGAPVLLALVAFGGDPGVRLMAMVISLGMAYEFSRMVFNLADKQLKMIAMLLLVLGMHATFLPNMWFFRLTALFILLFIFFLLSAGRFQTEDMVVHGHELMFSAFGLLYVGVLPLFLPLIRSVQAGMHLTLIFLLIVWAGDIGAYFVGKSFGNKKLYVEVSPNKTVEGAFGGLLFSILVAALYKQLFFGEISWINLLTVAVVVNVASQVGDLCESLLKRVVDQKNSGSILPGHGGIMDRFDGAVFAMPVMYACIKLLRLG